MSVELRAQHKEFEKRLAIVEAERDRISRINEENWAKLGGYVEAWGPLLARAEAAEQQLADLRASITAALNRATSSANEFGSRTFVVMLDDDLRALLATSP